MRRILLAMLIVLIPYNCFGLDIKSSSFNNGEAIAIQYTCSGQDLSPQFNWSNSPSNTKSFTLICEDIDAAFNSWVHWVIFNIPAEKTELIEGFEKTAKLSDGTIQGINDFGKNGYNGPCPPAGKPHRYFFKLYALDKMLGLDSNAVSKDVIKAIEGHILAEAKIMGTYQN